MSSDNVSVFGTEAQDSLSADTSEQSGNAVQAGKPLFNENIVDEVPVVLDVVLGQADMTVATLMGLHDGAVVELGANLNHKAQLRLNGRTIAYGELVAAGDKFGLKITEIGD